jgi:hypothetical protein
LDGVRPPVEPVDMAAQGWQITPTVPGFRKIRELAPSHGRA